MNPFKQLLRGRVELVYVDKPVSPHCAHGLLQAREVLVSGGQKYSGRDVLVRFDNVQDPNKSLPIGDFLTSTPPQYFSPLAPDQYVLCALWKESMYRMSEAAPTFKELRAKYSFGHATNFLFIHEYSTQTTGRYQVNVNGEIHKISRNSLGHLVSHGLPNPHASSRLIVVEGKNTLDAVGMSLVERNLIPILLEPIEE